MTHKIPASFKVFRGLPDGVVPDLSDLRTIRLQELNDGSFGIPEAHNNIRHPDYFEAKKEFDGFWSKHAKAQ